MHSPYLIVLWRNEAGRRVVGNKHRLIEILLPYDVIGGIHHAICVVIARHSDCRDAKTHVVAFERSKHAFAIGGGELIGCAVERAAAANAGSRLAAWCFGP